MNKVDFNYRLGLDLGVSSIGSAIVKIDADGKPIDIVDAGVRIFPVSEGASERREKRTARKNNLRTKKRLKQLANKLHSIGFWKYSKYKEISAGTKDIRKQDVYELRNNALFNKIESPEYIGRIFMHLAKHRGAGYISAQQENEESGNKNDPYSILPQKLKDKNLQTIGQYFYSRLQNKLDTHKQIRNRKKDRGFKNESTVDYAIRRYLVKDEFSKIWDKQAQYYTQLQDDELKQKIYGIIFTEKPPLPYAIGNCIYVKDEERLATAHPLHEQHRIYTSVHNIRYKTNQYSEKQELTIQQINDIVYYIMNDRKGNQTKIQRTEIQRILNLGTESKVYLSSKDGIKPYFYAANPLSNLSQDELIKTIEFITNPINQQNKETLLNEDSVIQYLIEKFGNDEKYWGHFLTKLPKGRGRLGKTALTKIIQEFKNSQSATPERHITDELAKTDPRFLSVDEKLKSIGQLDILPYYGKILTPYTQQITDWAKKRIKQHNKNFDNNQTLKNEIKYGKIANPAVHMMLNQLRLVINDIIRIYGKPSQVNIEVGREIGMSAEERDKHIKEQQNNTDINIEIDKKLTENVDNPLPTTDENRLKYKLADQQNWKDIFNPENDFGVADLPKYQVEHLVPQSLGGTNTKANLALTNPIDNPKKGNLFPYEYFKQHKSPEQIREIMKIVENFPENKKWRFDSDAKEVFNEQGDDDETNRYIADTQYFSRLAMAYIKPIIKTNKDNKTPPVLAIRGRHTEKLRRVWNLLGVEYELFGLTDKYPRYIPCEPYWVDTETGEVSNVEPDKKNWKKYDRKSNPEWIAKPRIDHRHHALDAIVVGLLNRSLMQEMTTKSKKGLRMEYPAPITIFGDDKNKFRKHIINLLMGINVSHKPNHSKQGRLHKDTGKTVIYEDKKQNICIATDMRPISDIFKTKDDLKKEFESSEESKKDKKEKFELSNDIKKHKKDIPYNFDKAEQDFNTCKNAIKDYWDEAIENINQENELLKSEQEQLEPRQQELKELQKNKIITEEQKIELTQINKKLKQKPQKTDNDKNIINNAINIANEKLNQPLPSKLVRMESKSALVYVPTHGGKGIGYNSGANHCIDIYTETKIDKKGKTTTKIGGEVIRRFDANNKDFIPKWRQQGHKILYKLHIGDILEMDTPDEFKQFCKTNRCFVKIIALDNPNGLRVCLHTDVRNGIIAKVNTNIIKNKYKFPNTEKELSTEQKEILNNITKDMDRKVFRKAISKFSNHNARKIELTPFGKIKRKHKVLNQTDKKE